MPQMKKKILLAVVLLITAVTVLSFLIKNSTLPSEIHILWRHYFPAPPDEKYYQEKYSKQATELYRQGKYREAIDVLRIGLGKVDNKILEADVINIHFRIIQLYLKIKNIKLALNEMQYLMDLAATPGDLVVSKNAVTEIYSVVITVSAEINNPELTGNFYKTILNYYKREFYDKLKNLDSQFDLDPELHNFVYTLERIKGSEEEMRLAQYILEWNKIKNNKHDEVVAYINKELIKLLCRKKEYSSAIKLLQKSLVLTQDQCENIKVQIKIAQTYIKAGNYSVATKKLEKTLSTISKLRTYYEYDKGYYFQDIANAYSDMGKYDLALKYLQKARRLFSDDTYFANYIDDDIKKVKEKVAKKLR